MKFLTTLTQVSHAGYPFILFYFIACIGIVLIFSRPQTAFLFSVFCLAAKNFHAAVYTRTPFLGPYLNLNDLLLWIALLAMITKYMKEREKIWAPEILLAIFGVVIIGDFQSLFMYGAKYQVLQRIWSTAIFPLMFLVGANMVKHEKEARDFYKILFIGVVFASIQHLYYVYFQQNVILKYTGYSQIRTISYITSGGASLLIGSVFASRNLKLNNLHKAIYYIGLALIGSSVLLSFTRGLWITALIAIVILPFLIQKKDVLIISKKKLVITVLMGIVILLLIFPRLQLAKQVNKRISSFTETKALKHSYQGRKIGQENEINIWLNGSIIFGYGSVLPADFLKKGEFKGAYYHVAYSTYLSHYGLIGLIIYQILLPILTINVGRRYYLKYSKTIGGVVSLIGVACAFMYILGFMWSNCYLVATTQNYGLIYGVVWGLNRGDKMRRSVNLGPNPSLVRKKNTEHSNLSLYKKVFISLKRVNSNSKCTI